MKMGGFMPLYNC